MFKRINFMLGIVWLVGGLSACEQKPVELVQPGNGTGTTGGNTTGGTTGGNTSGVTCDPDTVYFTNEVLPIFLSNCAQSACHDAATAQKGYRFDTYAHIVAKDIRPGRSGNSKVYKELFDGMPPNGPLSDEAKEKIRKWIDQGAKNNTCNAGCDSTKFKYSTDISKIINTNCAACHSSGNVIFNNYQGLKTVADNGRLWGAINHKAGYRPMPAESIFLSPCDINRIRKWIANGAPND